MGQIPFAVRGGNAREEKTIPEGIIEVEREIRVGAILWGNRIHNRARLELWRHVGTANGIGRLFGKGCYIGMREGPQR